MATSLWGRGFEHKVYDRNSTPFEVIEFLGSGGHGIVDIVKCTSGSLRGRVYARKVLKVSDTRLPSIQTEVNIAKRARHPHIVRFVGTYQSDNEYAILMTPVAEMNLMEYLNGADSASTGFRYRRDRVLPWLGCLGNALSYLHARNIRHGDVKPENILVLNGNVLFADFGVARDFPGETGSMSTAAITRMYCAPEVMENRHWRSRSADVFSLGAVFLEILTVYSGFGQLEKFKEFRKSAGDKTPEWIYAKNPEKVSHWIHLLYGPFHDVPRCTIMLMLCSRMLQTQPHQRPTADALWSFWTCRPRSTTPPTSCLGCSTAYMIGAAENGLELMPWLRMKKNVDLVAGQRRHRTLHIAAKYGHETMAEQLLEDGVDPNAADQNGQTALHMASANGHEAVIRLLLKRNADPNTADQNGWTAQQLATEGGHETVAELLRDLNSPASVVHRGHALDLYLRKIGQRLQDTSKLSTTLSQLQKDLVGGMEGTEDQKFKGVIGPELRQKLIDIDRECREVATVWMDDPGRTHPSGAVAILREHVTFIKDYITATIIKFPIFRLAISALRQCLLLGCIFFYLVATFITLAYALAILLLMIFLLAIDGFAYFAWPALVEYAI